MYDVEKLYVEKESMDERGLSEGDLIVPVEILDRSQMADLMEDNEVILSF